MKPLFGRLRGNEPFPIGQTSPLEHVARAALDKADEYRHQALSITGLRRITRLLARHKLLQEAKDLQNHGAHQIKAAEIITATDAPTIYRKLETRFHEQIPGFESESGNCLYGSSSVRWVTDPLSSRRVITVERPEPVSTIKRGGWRLIFAEGESEAQLYHAVEWTNNARRMPAPENFELVAAGDELVFKTELLQFDRYFSSNDFRRQNFRTGELV